MNWHKNKLTLKSQIRSFKEEQELNLSQIDTFNQYNMLCFKNMLT